MRLIFQFIAVCALAAAGCARLPDHPGDDQAELLFASAFFSSSVTGLTITASANNLSQSYSGTIACSRISLSLPYAKAAVAVPTITGSATALFVNGAPVTSGVTALDFSNTVVITAVNPYGFRQDYTVTTYLTAPVADTGQVNCYAGGGLSTCAATAASDPNQDGHFVSQKGIQPSSTNTGYPNDPINIDQLKGLVWKTCQEGFTGTTCAGGTQSAVTYAAAATLCTSLNSLNSGAGYAGIKKWRLPTWQELNQLQEHNLAANVYWNTAIFPNAPSTTGANLYRWTSSLVLPAATSSMALNELQQPQNTGTTNPVQCVSGDSPPADDLVDNGDGTILNRRTQLVWQKCSMGQTNNAGCTGALTTASWTNALLYCKNLTLAGRSWRLPSISELISLVDMSKPTPFLNTAFFPNLTVADFHSSTTMMANTAYDFILTLGTPTVGGISGKGNPYNAKCVSGP